MNTINQPDMTDIYKTLHMKTVGFTSLPHAHDQLYINLGGHKTSLNKQSDSTVGTALALKVTCQVILTPHMVP